MIYALNNLDIRLSFLRILQNIQEQSAVLVQLLLQLVFLVHRGFSVIMSLII